MAVTRYTINISSEAWSKNEASRNIFLAIANTVADLPKRAEVLAVKVEEVPCRWSGWTKFTARIRIKLDQSERRDAR